MSAISQLSLGGYQSRRYGSFAGRTASSTLLMAHEARKALEGALATAITTLTIQYPGQSVAIPSSGCWLRVRAIQWDAGVPASMGASSTRLARVRGRFVVDVMQRPGAGAGAANRYADDVRDVFTRTTPSVATGMQLTVFAPSGPTPGTDSGFAVVTVRVPFLAEETVPN